MTTLVTTDVVDGTTIDAADLNNNLTAIKAVINGNIDGSNISPSAAPTVATLTATSYVLAGSGAVSGSYSFAAQVLADSNQRLAILNTGEMRWGSGSAGWDTNLYRAAAGALKTDGIFYAGTEVYAEVAGGVQQVIMGNVGKSGGGLQIGGDTNLYRNSAGELSTDSVVSLKGTANYFAARTGTVGTNASYVTRISGDTNDRWQMRFDGTLQWGSGSLSPDTNLYRSAADTLKTDDTFNVGSLVSLNSSGFIELAEWGGPGAPAANRAFLWVEDNGAGKTRLMVRFNTGASQQIAIEP